MLLVVEATEVALRQGATRRDRLTRDLGFEIFIQVLMVVILRRLWAKSKIRAVSLQHLVAISLLWIVNRAKVHFNLAVWLNVGVVKVL